MRDKDREEIRKNIDQKVLRGEQIGFHSSAIEAASRGFCRVHRKLVP